MESKCIAKDCLEDASYYVASQEGPEVAFCGEHILDYEDLTASGNSHTEAVKELENG